MKYSGIIINFETEHWIVLNITIAIAVMTAITATIVLNAVTSQTVCSHRPCFCSAELSNSHESLSSAEDPELLGLKDVDETICKRQYTQASQHYQ